MSFPYSQCYELKLLGWGDLNETKATGGKHRALCPPVTTPWFAQLWPGPQTRLKPWCEEWSRIHSNSSCLVEHSVASLPFPNDSTAYSLIFPSGTKVRNPHIIWESQEQFFFRKTKTQEMKAEVDLIQNPLSVIISFRLPHFPFGIK